MVYFWVYDILYVLFNILNVCIASEHVVLKTTIYSLERDYIKKLCQHTGNIAKLSCPCWYIVIPAIRQNESCKNYQYPT